jgi:hypothetical protein
MPWRPCSQPLSLVLEEVADALGDAQMALAGVIEYGGGLGRAAQRAKILRVSRGLRRLAERLEQTQSTDHKNQRMCSTQLVEGLLQAADNLELLIAQVTEAEDLPPPVRAGIFDRLLEPISLLRLVAAEIEHPLGTDKTLNVSVDT